MFLEAFLITCVLFLEWLFYSEYDGSCHTGVGYRVMVSPELSWYFHARRNEELGVHNLSWIFWPCHFHNPNWVILQKRLPSQSVVTFYLSYCTSLRCRACSFPEYFKPKLWTTRWNFWGGCHISIDLGCFLCYIIHTVPVVGQVHHVRPWLLVIVHIYYLSLLQRCIHCVSSPSGFRQSWILLGLWTLVSWFTLLNPYGCLGIII